jgi:hypothetical protein
MRYAVILLLLLVPIFCRAQQKAQTFQDAERAGLTVQKLDNIYANAMDADTAKAVFKGSMATDFYKAYSAMLTDLSLYLQKNNFTWDKPTRIFHRIYFEPDGSIDYYLLNLKPANLTPEKETRLITLINDFAKNYKLAITTNKKFAQCSPAIYQDAK